MAQTPTDKDIKMMHIVNLMSIAYADGNISEDENNILVQIAQDLGLTEKEFDICVEHWKQTDEKDIPIAVPETDEDQVEFMKHFALMMMIDGEIEENERDYLTFVVDKFGYNPEPTVPKLIEDVYQEYFADDQEGDEEEDNEEEEEDPLFEYTDEELQIPLGLIKLEEKNISEAFDNLFLPALRNSDAYTYFLIIPNTSTRLFLLSPEQLAVVKEASDKGYPLADYVLGRYHQVVKPCDDSLDQAWHYLEKAVSNGIPDAQWALAMSYLYGYHGTVEMDEYNNLISQAFENGSMMAFKQHLHDIIHGVNGNKKEPKKAIKVIESFIEQDEKNADIHPDIYDLLGDAYRIVGNKEKADNCYEHAVDLGFFESGAKRFENRVEGPDKDFYRDNFSFLLDFACEDHDPNSFLARALEHVYHYDNEKSANNKDTLAKKIKEDLETAYQLGNGDAAYYLGLFCYNGQYGFPQDNQEAWLWFSRGQDYESGLAFLGTAQMVADGIHPSDLPDNYLESCQLSAQLRGAGRQDDSDAEIPTVFVVNPEGKATIYKLEKEDWYKLAHIIGANRIAPIRINSLDKTGQEAGFSDHLVAWIDIDAPRKGMAINKIAKSFFPGVICGDVVFSLADSIYDPVPFYGIDEAKNAIEALKADCVEIVTQLDNISNEKQKPIEYSKINPNANMGYVARIEPDGKAYITNSSLAVFKLFEEEIYDPARLKKLYDIGKKLGLKERLTIWTDNSALRKQLVINTNFTHNSIGMKFFPGPVADNIYVALEDENYRMILFDNAKQLEEACLALGVKPENICKD